MAKKSETRVNYKKLNSLVTDIDGMMDNLYKDTYSTDRQNSTDLEKITNGIEDNISNIISRNGEDDISNVSKMYSRLKLKSAIKDGEITRNVDELFNDNALTNSILSSYVSNKWIKDLDREYDTVCRYMPKLEEALAAKKDAVLSSDNFSKDFINANCGTLDKDTISTFSERVSRIKEVYNLEEFLDKAYDDAAKYGEAFIYHVPYSQALSVLMKNKKNTRTPMTSSSGIVETTIMESGVIQANKTKTFNLVGNAIQSSGAEIGNNLSIKLDTRCVLESAINDHKHKLRTLEITESSSMYEQFLMESKQSTQKFDETIGSEFKMPEAFESMPIDGLSTTSASEDKVKIKATGCILKKLLHENVIPIYIDSVCLGYYYIEFTRSDGGDLYDNLNDSYNSISYSTPTTKTSAQLNTEIQRNELLKYVSGSISKNIDQSFINSNQDLTSEIYAILKHNDIFNSTVDIESIRITFLPEEDVTHMTFNMDESTHRGISDLAKALIPAKLYSCLYITNTLGILTRGQDKRVYYVKQGVETNISQTLLSVINQIKKSNFGIRQIENMNTILNITGRFNDYLIPVGPSGDSPIQFEVMPGQEINPNTELMEKLEEMGINSTDVPLDLINARLSMDFAAQITMTNAKFLRHVYKRQSRCETYFSKILTILYNSEYDDDIKVNCVLSTPLFLNMTNINSLLDNTKTYAESIGAMEYDHDQSEKGQAMKAIFIKNLIRSRLSTYIKTSEIDRIKEQSTLEYILNSKKSEQDEE